MHIHIIGAGAIGLLIASKLHNRYPVTLYVRRDEQKKAIQKNGIHYYRLNQFVKNLKVHVQLLEEYSPGDIVFICVKQSELPSVLASIKPKITNEIVVFIQNGMSHISYLSELPSVYVGVVEHGAHRLNDYTVNHLGDGTIRLAPFHQPVEKMNHLHENFFPIELVTDWKSILHEKLLINAVINPITALFGCANGQIINNQYIAVIAQQICKETAQVLKLDVQQAWDTVVHVATKTKYNTSSMLADIQASRKTEIEAITGYVLTEATTSLPNTQFIYNAILAMEEGEMDAGSNN